MKRWTPKLALSRSRRRLKAACDLLAGVSNEWSDMDESLVYETEEQIRDLEDFSYRMKIWVAEQIADDGYLL